MPQVRRSIPGIRRNSGRLDILIIALISVVLVAALLYLLFKIIGHSEEHVEKVRNTKVLYNESLRWRPDSELCENRIRDDLTKFPNRKVAQYTDLNLNENCLELIGRMSRLEDLKLSRSTVQDPWLAHLTHMHLQSLGLHGSPVTDKAIPYILKFPYLTHLSIGDTELTDKGLEMLAASSHLTKLDLNLARCITTDGIKQVGKMTQLTHLELGNPVTVTGKCLTDLTGLKDLISLNLDSMPLTAEDLRALSSFKKLHSLDLSNCKLSDESLAEIAKTGSLRLLNLTGCKFTDKGLMALTKIKDLHSLTIKDCPNLHEEAIAKFRSSLPQCKVAHSRASALSEKMGRKNVKQHLDFLQDEVKNEMEILQSGSKTGD